MSYKLPILTLKPKRERSLVQRHPWVFSGAVATTPAVKNGAMVAVHSADGKWLGYAFYSSQSQITCRVFELDNEQADPTTKAYWKAKFEQALALRKQVVVSEDTNCYRLVNAEGDQLPGLIADVYGPVVVAQVQSKGVQNHWPMWTEILRELGYPYIYLQVKESNTRIEGVTLTNGWAGEEPAEKVVEVVENGITFLVDVENGQKTGFFLDQRDARALLGVYASGKKVLNTFSYTGGFSAYALKAGATEVFSVDISKEAINMCTRVVEVNALPPTRHKGVVADCFDYLKNADDDFDIIVLDPPAFAKSAKSVPNATKGYKELNLQAFKKIAPGGLLFTFSCSQHVDKELFRKVVFGAAADARRHVRILYQTSQPPDHPISIYHPEGEYLKGLVLQVE